MTTPPTGNPGPTTPCRECREKEERIERLEKEVSVARERFGPAGYKILREVNALRSERADTRRRLAVAIKALREVHYSGFYDEFLRDVFSQLKPKRGSR